jgi:hypothetical protein
MADDRRAVECDPRKGSIWYRILSPMVMRDAASMHDGRRLFRLGMGEFSEKRKAIEQCGLADGSSLAGFAAPMYRNDSTTDAQSAPKCLERTAASFPAISASAPA